MIQSPSLVVGTAGWSIARELAPRFQASGSSLARYASLFMGVEVNSSFYRRNRQSTWQRWHDAVSNDFRFAVKLPKVITHELRLADAASQIAVFLGDIAPLGDKLGPLLVQLPPSLVFDAGRDQSFFADLRKRSAGRIVIEPRHVSWASSDATMMLGDFAIDRVMPIRRSLNCARRSIGAVLPICVCMERRSFITRPIRTPSWQASRV